MIVIIVAIVAAIVAAKADPMPLPEQGYHGKGVAHSDIGDHANPPRPHKSDLNQLNAFKLQ